MADYCPICGANIGLVGPRHRCVPRAKPDWIIAAEAKAGAAANAPEPAAAVASVSQSDVVNAPDVTNSEPPMTNATKVTYRYRDADKWRAYMRAYMAKRRSRRLAI